jgi:multiple sugar transport system substrate-binding protein
MKKLFGVFTVMMLIAGFSIGVYAKETIIYYLWDDPTHANIINAFNSSQDEVFVDAKVIPAKEYEAKILTLLAGGAEMDAYMNKRSTDIFPMADNGYAEPLNDLIAKHKFDMAPLAGYKDAITINGKVYCLPFRGEAYFTYYNKKVFAQAGIPTPDTYVEKGEWTWEKFVEVAKKLATGDGKVYGAIMYLWGSSQVIPADQRGIHYITADGKIDVDDSLVYSLKLRKGLEQAKAIMSLAETKATKTHYSKAFWNGNAGMLLIGGWFPGMMLTAKKDNLLQGYTWNDWALTRLPCNEKEYRTPGIPTSNVLHSASKKKDAAFKFLAWMSGPQGAPVVAQNGFMTAIVTPEVKEAFKAVLPDDKSLQYFTEASQHVTGWFGKYGSQVEAEIVKVLEEYLMTEMADNQLMDTLKAHFEEVLKTSK